MGVTFSRSCLYSDAWLALAALRYRGRVWCLCMRCWLTFFCFNASQQVDSMQYAMWLCHCCKKQMWQLQDWVAAVFSPSVFIGPSVGGGCEFWCMLRRMLQCIVRVVILYAASCRLKILYKICVIISKLRNYAFAHRKCWRHVCELSIVHACVTVWVSPSISLWPWYLIYCLAKFHQIYNFWWSLVQSWTD